MVVAVPVTRVALATKAVRAILAVVAIVNTVAKTMGTPKASATGVGYAQTVASITSDDARASKMIAATIALITGTQKAIAATAGNAKTDA